VFVHVHVRVLVHVHVGVFVWGGDSLIAMTHPTVKTRHTHH